MMQGSQRWGRAVVGRAAVVVLAAIAVLAGGCTTTEGSASPGASASKRSTTASTAPHPECTPDVPKQVAAAPVVGSTTDIDVTSFDGTRIRAHWFPVGSPIAPVPTVLMGPGWGMPGDTNVDAVGVLGAVNIATLRNAGYNVLTWDPRGFGASGGQATVDSVDNEARDVQQLITWVAAQPAARSDGPGDPRVGMVGGSYGGGIQFVTAAIDCRIDAIVPIIAWHSLVTSLYKDQTVKEGWATILASVAMSASLDPHITSADDRAVADGVLSADDVAWFAARGPGDLVKRITAPTMVVGGTVDTLFTLDEDVGNYRILRDAGVPVSMYWFCGGHGVCLTDKGDEQRMVRRIVAWLDRWVKQDRSVDVGPRIDVMDQAGVRYTADDYPMRSGPPITATGSGTLALAAGGGSGPAVIPAGKADGLADVVSGITPWPATRSLDVAIPVAGDALVLGAPQLELTYTGSTPPGARPTRLFAQVVDRASGTVVGNQVTPVPITLDGVQHQVSVPLEVIAQKVAPTSRLQLQLVATTTAYSIPRLGGTITVAKAAISLPTVTGYTVVH
ncbi:MAG: alpha/beta hydrolase [Actinobacteria bacterium]|nr:alpha/beta hydrolase [Actinomycetota bacterium]